MMRDKTTPFQHQPIWRQALEPRLYAQPWFAATRFEATVATAFLKIDGSADDNQAILAVAKSLLAQGREAIKTRFLADNDGALYVGGYALMMDCLIKALFKKINSDAGDKAQADFTLVATGGYGRGELAPQSDIDLLFLTPIKPDKATIQSISKLLYILWDMGLKIGHASRSLRQQLAAARSDFTIRTALIEARFLCGDESLFDMLMAKFNSDIVATTAYPFIRHKLEERDRRHAVHGDHRYAAQPNIKEGKGALRDLHTLFWIARYAQQTQSLDAIISSGILTMGEVRAFAHAQRFLLTVRCHLHLRAGREDDQLTFDAQADIAAVLGFHDRKTMRGVERFMRRYYLAAKTVGNLTRIFCAAFAADFTPSARFWPNAGLRQFFAQKIQHKKDGVGGATGGRPSPFALDANRLTLPKNTHFRQNPALMMRLFAAALEYGVDIHPDALRKLHQNLNLIDAEFRASPEINADFLAILTAPNNPERILRLMNESGFLGKFMPEFARIVALMQFDMYHSYTVDEHTVYAMGILHKIANGALAEIAPVATEAAQEITLKKELSLAVFLHDIAKGRGGDHSILGAEVARQICPRLGLDETETETIAWLIRHHLLMSRTAFHYDLNDPSTIADFAAIVQSPERLNLLLVLTVADIRAVGPNVWNGWKAALMRTLYARTMAYLRGGEGTDADLNQIIDDAIAGLSENLLSTWGGAAIADYVAKFYPSYWTGFDRASHHRHALAFIEHQGDGHDGDAHDGDGDLLTIRLTPDLAKNATELCIITADDAGLFARIAGGVASAGAHIVDARFTTRKDGLTLDALWIQNDSRCAITDVGTLDRIRQTLEDALTGTLDIEAATERRHRQRLVRIRQLPAPARVLCNNAISKTHTVLEINGKDSVGLLYKLTSAIARLGLQIQMASVSTYGNRVVDVFYIKDGFGLKITNEARLEKIRAGLMEVLHQSTEEDCH